MARDGWIIGRERKVRYEEIGIGFEVGKPARATGWW